MDILGGCLSTDNGSDLAYCTTASYQTSRQKGRDEYFGWLRCSATSCSEVGRNTNDSSFYCSHLDHTPFWRRHITIRQLGERCFPVLDNSPPNAPGSNLIFGNNTTFLQTFEEIRNCRSTRSILGGDKESTLQFVAGDLQTAAIFSINDGTNFPLEDHLNSAQMSKFFDTGHLDAQKIFEHLHFSDKIPERLPLMGCAIAAELYADLPHATISTLVLSRPLSSAHWLKQTYQSGQLILELTLPQTFGCLAMFDSGTVNLEPSSLSEAFAMSSGILYSSQAPS
jgi:hypothetical protein